MTTKYRLMWEEALRRRPTHPDSYVQCTGRLHSTLTLSVDAFCCLGVARNILVEEGAVSPKIWNGSITRLTSHELALLGISLVEQDALINLNDISLAKFPDIAKKLKKWRDRASGS